MATAPAVRAGSSIEALFRPSNHYFRGRLPEGFTEELELLPGLTTENVLATGVTWGDFLRFLQGKFLWMAPDVYVIPRYVSGLAQSLVLGLGGYDIVTNMFVRVTEDTAAAAATATCDFLVRLLATCEERGVSINGCCNAVPLPLSGAALSLFLQESRDSLRKVTLYDMTLSEDQCRALATMSRLDVELDMYNCSLVDDAAGAFIECLQSDKGPIKLNGCEIDNQIIASALTGKSRVTRLELVPVNDTEHDVIFRVLANNRGLLDLDLQFNSISDENWTILCESLKAHPTLTSLHLQRTWPRSPTGGRIVPTDDQKTSRTHVVAEMMQHNTVLQSISLSGRERDEQIYTAEIIPYLETNRYRPRVHGITKADIPLRRALLGMALHTVSARKDTNLIWMFLSGNSDVVVQSNEES